MIIIARNQYECKQYCFDAGIPFKIDYYVNRCEHLLGLKRGTEIHLVGRYKESKLYKDPKFKELAKIKGFKLITVKK